MAFGRLVFPLSLFPPPKYARPPIAPPVKGLLTQLSIRSSTAARIPAQLNVMGIAAEIPTEQVSECRNLLTPGRSSTVPSVDTAYCNLPQSTGLGLPSLASQEYVVLPSSAAAAEFYSWRSRRTPLPCTLIASHLAPSSSNSFGQRVELVPGRTVAGCFHETLVQGSEYFPARHRVMLTGHGG